MPASSRYIFYLFYTLFKRWKAYALFFLVSVSLTVFYVWHSPWYYESNAQLVIKADDQDISEANSHLVPQQTQQTSSEIIRRIINTHLGVFHSRDVTHETLVRLGLPQIYPEIVAAPPRFFGTPMDAAIERFDKNDLSITVPPNSNVLQLSLSNRSPAMAQKALSTLITVFLAKDAEVMRDPRTQFLTDQVEDARGRVDTIQKAILTYKQQNSISSLEDERSLLLKQRDLLEQNLGTENAQSLHVSLTAAQATLAAAEQNYLRFEQTYAPDNPVRQRAQVALNLARQQYKTLVSMITGSNQNGNKLAGEWTSHLNTINSRLDILNQAEVKLNDLQRQLDIATQTFLAFSQRLVNAKFTLALNRHGTPNVAISQEPTLPYTPAHPRIRLVLGMGVVIGLLGGLGLCFLLEAVDETIGLPDEVEPLLGLPMLATLDYSRRLKAITRTPRPRLIRTAPQPRIATR